MPYLPFVEAAGTKPIKRRRAVRWLSVTQLIKTGIEVARVGWFTKFADKRDDMATTPREFYSMQPAAGDQSNSFWMDFTADTGDGFDATVTVATVLSDGENVSWTAPPGHSVPFPQPQGPSQRRMADLLVLGGDEVYPVATQDNYESRFLEVFAYARRWASGVEDHNARYNVVPRLAALPGNHDWYDALVVFRQLLCESWTTPGGQREPTDGLVRVADHADTTLNPDSIAGWGAFQSRSYFAVHLWGDWWLWGIDSQLNRDVDAHQIDYFADASERLGESGQVILCTATPAWLEADIRDVGRTDSEPTLGTLLWFIHRTLGPDRRHRVRLIMTGDKHHYVRYEASAEGASAPALVTCGGGGAFLSSTHNLPQRLDIKWRRWNLDLKEPAVEYKVARSPLTQGEAMFPSRKDSRANVALFRWLAVTWRNGPLLPLLIAILDWSGANLLARLGFPLIGGSLGFNSLGWAIVLVGITLAALAAFAWKGASDVSWPSASRRGFHRVRWSAACVLLVVVHVVLQLLAVYAAMALADLLPVERMRYSVVVFALLALLGTVAFAGYLHFANLLGLHDLEAYSAMGLTGYKAVVRLRIDQDGVTAFVWGIRSVPRYGKSAVPPDRPISAELVDSFLVASSP